MTENNLLTNRPPVLGSSVGIPAGSAKAELTGGLITLRFTQTGDNIASASPVMKLQTSYSLDQEYVLEGLLFTCALTCDPTSTSAIVAAACFNTFDTTHRLTESSNTLVAVNCAIDSILNTTQGVTFPYGMRLPQGSRLELYAASPSEPLNVFDVIATFYFRKWMAADGERGEATPGGVMVTLVYQADNPPPVPQQFVLLENGLQILLEDGNNLDLEG